MTKNDGKNISLAFCSIITIVLSCVSIYCWIQYASNFDIYEESCYINDVKVPHSLPNYTYSDMWANCDCGKNCWTKTPVADIYVQLGGKKSDSIRTIYSNKKKDKGYTIYDDVCQNGEDMVNTINNFNEIQKYKLYLNTTRICYKTVNGKVYLFYEEYDILIPSILTGIVVILILFNIAIDCFCDEEKKKIIEAYEV